MIHYIHNFTNKIRKYGVRKIFSLRIKSHRLKKVDVCHQMSEFNGENPGVNTQIFNNFPMFWSL